MKKLHGLPLLLVNFLKQPSQTWTSKGHLTAEIVWKHPSGKNYGKRYLPETVGRALRSLEEQKIIAVRDSGISVEYKYLPSEMREWYIPSSARPESDRSKLFKDRPKRQGEEMETEVEIVGSVPYKE